MPDHALISTSSRTRETWQRMVGFADSVPMVATRSLYHAGIEDYCAVLGEHEDTERVLLTLAHNPGCEGFVQWLSGVPVRMTTANCALLEGDGATWAEAVRPRAWRLVDLLRPREIS